MGRRELREQIFKLLFRAEFHMEEDMQEQLVLFFDDEEQEQMTEKDEAYISQKCKDIVSRLTEIDDLINQNTQGWNTERMGKVDLTLIRLAVYEIRFDVQIPTGVAINEAVELAKKYGQEQSSGFVNGVLAKLA